MRIVGYIPAVSVFLLLLVLSAARPCRADAPDDALDSRSSVLERVGREGKLLVGMHLGVEPFAFFDAQGRAVGFDVDLANLAAMELGAALEIKDIRSEELIPALEKGEIDMVVSRLRATPRLARNLAFSDPYFVTGLCALVSRKKSPKALRVSDLNVRGKILAVRNGTAADLVASRLFTEAEVRRFEDEAGCERAVVAARADAFLSDQFAVARLNRQNPESTMAILKPFTYEPMSIAIRKGDFDGWNWLNIFLRAIKSDGRYAELYERYFRDLPPLNMLP